MFEGKTPIARAWWISRVFFSWIGPLMKFAQKHDELAIENYGDIREKDKVDHQIEKLRGFWEADVKRGVSNNTLIFTMFRCYKWNLLYLMLCNFFSICL